MKQCLWVGLQSSQVHFMYAAAEGPLGPHSVLISRKLQESGLGSSGLQCWQMLKGNGCLVVHRKEHL